MHGQVLVKGMQIKPMMDKRQLIILWLVRSQEAQFGTTIVHYQDQGNK